MEGLLAFAPVDLPVYFIVLDDAERQLRSLLRDVLPPPPQCWVEVFPDDVEVSPSTLITFINSHDCDVLLINGHIDPHPPGDVLRALLATYCGKAPFRIMVFATDEVIDDVGNDLLRRGVDAIVPLSALGVQRLPRYLEKLWQSPTLVFTHPEIKPDSLRSDLASGWLCLLQSLFDEAEEVTFTELMGKGVAARKLHATTGEGRRYFVKLGRWDSLAAEYANYLDLIQGKHENYAGRAIGRLVVHGSDGALRFSLAGAGRAGPKPLRDFLHDADVVEGDNILRNLKRRLVDNLTLWPETAFRPHRFLRVLPPALTLRFDRFVDRQKEKSPPGLAFPPSEESSRIITPQALGRFLVELSPGQLVRTEALAIQEIKQDPDDHSGVIVQLTDVQEDGKPEIGYKVNIKIPDAALLSSPKLHRGNRPVILGSVESTLDDTVRSLCEKLPDILVALDLERWEPDSWLYDLLFGGEAEGQLSLLEQVHNVTIGDFVHGDFNLNNILVEERENERLPWLIDFEKSAHGFYPAADWAKLEVEIAIHLAAKELSLSSEITDVTRQLSELEHALWCPMRFAGQVWVPAKPQEITGETQNRLHKAFHWQDLIRRLVAEELPTLTSVEFADYLFAVICYSLQALRYADEHPHPMGKYATYIKAAVACKRIYQILAEENQGEGPELR